jgi:hypothetical protein
MGNKIPTSLAQSSPRWDSLYCYLLEDPDERLPPELEDDPDERDAPPPLDMDDPEDLELPTLELGGVLLVVLLLEVLLGLVVVVFCLVVPERCVVVV